MTGVGSDFICSKIFSRALAAAFLCGGLSISHFIVELSEITSLLSPNKNSLLVLTTEG